MSNLKFDRRIIQQITTQNKTQKYLDKHKCERLKLDNIGHIIADLIDMFCFFFLFSFFYLQWILLFARFFLL